MRPASCFMLLALSLTPASFAQAAPDAFDVCAREADPTARLACFDRQVAARHPTAAAGTAGRSGAPAATVNAAVAPKVAPAAAPAPAPAPVPASNSDVGLDARQLHKLHPERAESEKADAPVVVAKVVRVMERRPLISAFELDNGQVWEQTETVSGLYVRPQESVTIIQGIMGGFQLRSAEGKLTRVHRVK